MQISPHYHYLFLYKFIDVLIVCKHSNICVAGLDRRAGYATDDAGITVQKTG